MGELEGLSEDRLCTLASFVKNIDSNSDNSSEDGRFEKIWKNR